MCEVIVMLKIESRLCSWGVLAPFTLYDILFLNETLKHVVLAPVFQSPSCRKLLKLADAWLSHKICPF